MKMAVAALPLFFLDSEGYYVFRSESAESASLLSHRKGPKQISGCNAIARRQFTSAARRGTTWRFGRKIKLRSVRNAGYGSQFNTRG